MLNTSSSSEIFRQNVSLLKLSLCTVFTASLSPIALIPGTADRVVYTRFLFDPPFIFIIYAGLFLSIYAIYFLVSAVRLNLRGMPTIIVGKSDITTYWPKRRTILIDDIVKMDSSVAGVATLRLRDGSRLPIPFAFFRNSRESRRRVMEIIAARNAHVVGIK